MEASPQEVDHAARRPPLAAAAVVPVLLYAAAIYLPFLGSARTLTPHEVMVTHPALRILEDGHWIVPRYASGFWLDKPPLASWLTAACFAVAGGFGEFAARLPAAVSAILLCGVVALLAARFETRRAALLAGLVQATCVYTYMQGRLGEPDMPFVLLVTAAHGVLFWRWGQRRFDLPLAASAAFHVLAALAVLTKGALALVFLGATIAAFAAVQRSWRPLRAVLWTPGVVLFVVIAGGWHVAAYLSVGRDVVGQWGYNSVLRFLGLHHLGSQSILYYFWTIPWLMLPWMIALVIGARRLFRDARRPAAVGDGFLWCWFFAGLLFLTICFFKHKHYAIPILPPLSILAGRLLDLHMAWREAATRRFYVMGFAVLLVVFSAISGVVLPRRDHRRPTAQFARSASANVPDGAKLCIFGLAQSSAYPYVEHRNCLYVDTLPEVQKALYAGHEAPMWTLTLRRYVAQAADHGLQFDEVACEPVRAKHPAAETLVLGRLSFRAAESNAAP